MAISDELRKLVDPNNYCCCEHCLSNKCKKWAYKQGYLIGLNSRQGITLIDRNTNMTLRYISIDSLEQLVRFELDLCQWILDNKDKDE